MGLGFWFMTERSTLPPLRVPLKLRRRVEAALEEGETLSGFILEAVTTRTEERESQRAFIARGLASARRARATGNYLEPKDVLAELDAMTAAHRARSGKRK
jgi:predicted transcriptional regulator